MTVLFGGRLNEHLNEPGGARDGPYDCNALWEAIVLTLSFKKNLRR